jgi:predicted ribosomally synthesized peptide with SipW-like signal peptide
MNKKIIFVSIFVIGMLALAMGYGTYSYFSSTRTSSGNLFTAGTLNLQLSNDYANWYDGVTATWTSPSGWAPGQSFTNTLYLWNKGSVDAQVVYQDWKNLYDPDGLSNWIQVTEISDSIPWNEPPLHPAYGTNYVGNFITASVDLNGDGMLSLAELASWGDRKTTSGSPHPWDITTSAGVTPSSPPPALPAGDTLGLRFTFKLMVDTPNAMQGTSCSIDLNVMASNVALAGIP